jgi:parvulin-like peptidyl-prolyl isomerase
MGAKGRQPQQSVGRQRLALIIFGALFVLLFAALAIAQGLTPPSVPSGAVAHVSDVPDEIANISEEELRDGIYRQATSGEQKLKKPPEPGSDKYEELKTNAMTELIEGVWLRGEAEERGITVTEKQIEDELATIKKQSFPGKGAFEKFLKESRYSAEQVDDLVELQILVKEIQERVNGEAPPPSSAEIEAYYDAEKEAQFTSGESRDVRIILNKDKGKVEAAKAELDENSSPGNWKKVAAKFSTDPTSKSKGGLQEGITEEFLQGSLKTAIFEAATSELVGPVEFQGNFVLVEVVKLNPAKVQTLEEAKAQIESTLSQETQQEYFAEFAADYRDKWAARTRCASGFEVEPCANYRGNGHPSNANPACYEADPKTPATECPSPVTPISPALPGSITVAKPKGEPFPQRPRPEGLAEQGEEVPTPTGVPPTGTPPPTGE